MARERRSGRRGAALAALLLVATTFPASAVLVDGFVRDGEGAPVPSADLDWFNRDTGENVDPSGDQTDGTGYFSVDVPAGTYDITVIPPDELAPVLLENVDLTEDRTLADTIVPDGFTVNAHVQTAGGSAVENAMFVFTDVDTDEEAFLLDDDTDVSGDLTVVIPVGVYDLVVKPDPPYAPLSLEDFDTDLPADLSALTVRIGYTVTGRVTDDEGVGIPLVDIDVVDESTGNELYTDDDDTDFLGEYSVFVPAGTYELLFTPTPSSPYAAERLEDVVISGSADLGDVVLLDAVTVTGRMLAGGGIPIVGGDVDVLDATTGTQRYTPDDNADATGAWSVKVPVGVYDIHLKPTDAFDLAAAALWNVDVVGSTSVGDVTLVPGSLVTGTVTGGGGGPVPFVDLDFIVGGTGKTYPTPGDDTGLDGTYRVRVAPDVYDVGAEPPAGSGFGSATREDEALFSDTVLDFVLPVVVAVDPTSSPAPRLLRIAPNPFRSSVGILLASDRTWMEVSVHDAAGRRIARLDGTVPSPRWDGRDAGGEPVAPGVYFLRATARDGSVEVARVTRVR